MAYGVSSERADPPKKGEVCTVCSMCVTILRVQGPFPYPSCAVCPAECMQPDGGTTTVVLYLQHVRHCAEYRPPP